MDADAYGTLICSAFSEDFGQYNGEDHHIFVLLTNQWLLLLMYTIDLPGGVERNAEVMNLMAAAAEYSVRASLMNCGCYFNLPWLSSLCYTRSQRIPVAFVQIFDPYMRLIHALWRLQQESLLTGEGADALPEMVRNTHVSDEDPCRTCNVQDAKLHA